MIFHVDANSFYASCERLFRPDLVGKPIAVLSNNDWFIIALNQECKNLGFKRGDPISTSRGEIEKNGVAVFSSNYTLYADISARLNLFYENYSPEIEIYSIDETFLFFPDWRENNYTNIGKDLYKKAEKNIGIPVSVGIAPNKTLAKICNKLAKKQGGVCNWAEIQQDEVLANYAVGDIWGIGRAKTDFLKKQGIQTALQLKNYPLNEAKKNLTIEGLRTVQELNGINAIDKKEVNQREMILCSRSFKGEVLSLEEITSALAEFTHEAVKRLRENFLLSNFVTVFLSSDPYKGDKGFYRNKSFVKLYDPSDFLPEIQKAALQLLNQIYREGFFYRKTGILLSGLISKNKRQLDLFYNGIDEEKKDKLMSVFQKVNSKYGRGTLRLGVSDIGRNSDQWETRRDLLSPEYTTKISDIPKVH